MFLFSQENAGEKKLRKSQSAVKSSPTASLTTQFLIIFLICTVMTPTACTIRWSRRVVATERLFERRRFQHFIQRSFRLPKAGSQLDTLVAVKHKKLPSSQTDPPVVLAESNIIAQNKQKKNNSVTFFCSPRLGPKEPETLDEAKS